MNFVIPVLPSWAHMLSHSTAVTSFCYCFPQIHESGVCSLDIYPCKILTSFRHWCFPAFTIVWSPCHLFLVVLKVAGILIPVAALRYVFSALCDLFITLFIALDPFSRPIPSIFWIPGILFTCGPAVTVLWWWASFMGRERLANAGPAQHLLTPWRVAAAFVLLHWVSKCHD